MAHEVNVSTAEIIQHTRTWVRTVVIKLNLCPFANAELNKNSIRFHVSQAVSNEQLLQDLVIELELLKKDSSIETTLLIHPQLLNDFTEYNQFLNFIDAVFIEMNYTGVFQIASFHPDYVFEKEPQLSSIEPQLSIEPQHFKEPQHVITENLLNAVEQASDYSNRSPYPMLHILRESSVSNAVQRYPDIESIPQNNIKKLQQMGAATLSKLLLSCYDDTQ